MNIRLFLLDVFRGTKQYALYRSNMIAKRHISRDGILDYWAKAKNEIVNFHIANNKEYAALLEAKGVDLKNWKFEDLPILTKKICQQIWLSLQRFLNGRILEEVLEIPFLIRCRKKPQVPFGRICGGRSLFVG